MQISKRAREIQESPIRKLAAIANDAKKRGISIYHLNIGQPDIKTPEIFFDNIKNFSEKVLAYGPSDGLESLKNVIVKYFAYYDIHLKTKSSSLSLFIPIIMDTHPYPISKLSLSPHSRNRASIFPQCPKSKKK